MVDGLGCWELQSDARFHFLRRLFAGVDVRDEHTEDAGVRLDHLVLLFLPVREHPAVH